MGRTTYYVDWSLMELLGGISYFKSNNLLDANKKRNTNIFR